MLFVLCVCVVFFLNNQSEMYNLFKKAIHKEQSYTYVRRLIDLASQVAFRCCDQKHLRGGKDSFHLTG